MPLSPTKIRGTALVAGRRLLSVLLVGVGLVTLGRLSAPAAGLEPLTVGVVGCSNTTQYAGWDDYGYAALSDVDALALIPNAYRQSTLGGFTFQGWGDPEWVNAVKPSKTYDEAWLRSREHRPDDGFDAYWVNPCPHVMDGDRPEDAVWQEWTTHIRDQIWELDPGIPIYWSAMADYVDGSCDAMAYRGEDVRDWAVANLDGVEMGPELAPLTADLLGRNDGCHVNAEGADVQGAILVEWFDTSDPTGSTTTTSAGTTTTTMPPTTTTVAATTTTLDPRCENRPSHPACS